MSSYHNEESTVSGLCYISDMQRHPFPLQSIKVSTRVLDLNAQVQVTQSYRFGHDTDNIFDQLTKGGHAFVECVYVFPLDEYSAISHFECTIDGKTVHGVVKPKAAAKREYEAAITSNKQAALLQQHAENVFECRVGHMSRSSTADIKLTYLTTLIRAGAQHQLVVPMIVAPKYTPAVDLGHPTSTTHIPHTTALPRSFVFECDMEMASRVVKVECQSHPEMVITKPDDINKPNTAHASLTLSDTCSLSRDLVLSIQQEKPFDPRCIVEYDPSLDCCAVSLSLDCPSLSLSDASQLQSEYVFLLDRSGSMEGESITALQQSVSLLIKSLPSQCRFQIIGFGSEYKSLFSAGSVAYSDASVKKAVGYTSKLAADMGGTELYKPLKRALTSGRTEWPRSVFVITDGQVSNTGQLVSLIAQHRSNTRVFSIGIGSGVDRALCRKLARAGAGECEFVSLDRAGDMKSSVLRQLGRAMQPMITDVKVDWGVFGKQVNKNSATTPSLCPEQPSAVFPGTRFGVYLLDCQLPEDVINKIKANITNNQHVAQSIDAFEHIVTITAHTNQSGKPSVITMKVPITASHLTHGSVIGRLAARTRIAELEQRHAETPFDPYASNLAPYDTAVENLAMRFGLASRATSFLVVFDNVAQDMPDEEAGEMYAQSASFSRMRSSASFSRMRSRGRGTMNMLCSSASACPPPPPACAAPMMRRSMAAPMPSGPLQQDSCDDECEAEVCDLFDSAPAPAIAKKQVAAKKKSSLFGSVFGKFKQSAPAAEEQKREMAASIQSAQSESTFDKLIMAQNANGSWDLNESFVKTIQAVDASISATHVNMKVIQSLVQAHSSLKQAQEVITTLMVLSVLRRYFASRSDDWQFIEGKAKSFVDQRCDAAEQQVIAQSLSNLNL